MARQTDYEPMTLGNMRAHGTTRLDVSCHGPDCWHRAMVDMSRFADNVIVREFGRRFYCSRCGSRNIDARPDWIQYAEHYRRSVKPHPGGKSCAPFAKVRAEQVLANTGPALTQRTERRTPNVGLAGSLSREA
jgi:hypothetical protein